MAVLRKQPLAPPSLPEAMQVSHAGEELVRALAQSGEIVRVSDDVAFAKDAYASAVGMGKGIIGAAGSVTGARLRDRMGASPRPVRGRVQNFDAHGRTRALGDARA